MMLQSCYAVFATSILNSVSFHCFLAHIELEQDRAFCCLESSSVAMQRKKQNNNRLHDGLSNQEKKYAKKLYLPTFVKP